MNVYASTHLASFVSALWTPLGVVALAAEALGIGFLLAGTALVVGRFSGRRRASNKQDLCKTNAARARLSPPPGPWRPFAAAERAIQAPGVSVLKPVKGVEPGLEDCLKSFFAVEYPRFELLFCVADADDSAIPLVRQLIARHPRVVARLSVGAEAPGFNPKINNLARSYREAAYDWVLIADSNVRATPDFISAMTADFADDVGVVTAVVAGVDATNWAGRLEADFLNGFHARWILIAEKCGLPLVIGKAMLFRKREAERFGGLAALGRYLAEDYMAGRAMAYIGLRTKVASFPVAQPLGKQSFASFWGRHLRWGRIRRAQNPPAHFMEFTSFAIPSGLLGAFAMQTLFNYSWSASFAAHMALWLACEALQTRALGGRFGWREGAAWLAREALSPLLWAQALAGRTVSWRGQKLVLARGGLLAPGRA